MPCRYHFEFVYVSTLKVTLVVIRFLFVLYNYVYVQMIIYFCALLVTSFMIGLKGSTVRLTTVYKRVHLL